MFTIFDNDKFLLFICVLAIFMSGGAFSLLFIGEDILNILSALSSVATICATFMAWKALIQWKKQDRVKRLNDRFMSLAVQINSVSYKVPTIKSALKINDYALFSKNAFEYLQLRRELINVQRELHLYKR